MAPQGRVLPIGFASGLVPQIPANLLLVKNITVFGLYMGCYKIDARSRHATEVRALFAQLANWLTRGLIKPVVSDCLPLEQTAQAFERVLDRGHVGHVVVVMDAAN